MPSERIQRRIDTFLDEADAASTAGDWAAVAEKASAVLAIDPENEDAKAFLQMVDGARAASGRPVAQVPAHETASQAPHTTPAPALPASFVAGRYAVRRFLGEGGRKRVYLAHDSRLDREVAFCAIRMDGLDLVGHERVRREAQAMGRLGGHPNLVPIYDIGDDGGTPFIVEEFMGGGDVAGLLEKADDHRLPVERTLAIAKDVCGGLAFIHGGGLVHRDLKPANVFLAADGTAKIGDFGLAVALDRSRLTQHGMMLGTVAYMPPEQALGGESTPKADLYSLGAMLYEMVTGKPPFVGDDPTTVISQHINTPPVAPSWVTEHCPPSLEEVILHLLEKDPSDRPGSSVAVLKALEAVNPTQKSATHSDSNVLDRLARGVFVGREKELERLRKALDEAFSGRGGMVMLVGEPGIGKTRTTEELGTYARMRGGRVLWGRAHESSGAPPYWPWKQVGDSHARFVPPAELAGELDQEQVAELARIFPMLRANAPPAPVSDPESAQFRLFDAYCAFIRAGAERAPLLIVLDDLHWADKPSLLLLQHFAREFSHVRALVVCTYRDTDLSRTHPLSEALATLNREAGFLRIPLRGLSRQEVEAYIRAAANVGPPARVVDRIFEETEGNPFFLSEVVNLLTQEGTLMSESVTDIAVPDGVREALGRRLDRISKDANELLQVCAVAGREFTYDTLTLLDERSEDEVLRLIEEAVEARVIEEMEQPGRYRFTHALMQETLLDELTTTRRVRLHGQVGEALEKRWGDRAPDYASRLATHFLEAATLAPRFADKALSYTVLAAEAAERQSAWDNAAAYYGRALDELTAASSRADEAGLLLALARCEANRGAVGAQGRAARRAFAIYRDRGDVTGAARAALETLTSVPAPAVAAALAKDALALLDRGEPYLEARLLGWLIHRTLASQIATSEYDSARQRLAEILAVHGFEDVQAQVDLADGFRVLYAGDPDAAAKSFDNAHVRFEEQGANGEASFAWFWHCIAVLFIGDLEVGRQVLAAGRTFEIRHKIRRYHQLFYAFEIGVVFARCQFDEVERLADEAATSGSGDPHHLVFSFRALHALVTGDFEAAVALLPDEALAPRIPLQQAYLNAVRARLLWNTGHLAEARAAFARVAELIPQIPEAEIIDGIPLHASVVSFLDDALLPLAGEEWVRRVPFLSLISSPFNATAGISHGRLLAEVFLNQGNTLAAERTFQEALAWCERERCPVEAGRNLQGLAEVAARRGDVTAALDDLDRAAALFQRHGARLYLDQVIAKKVELQGLTSDDMRSSIVSLNTAVQSEPPDLLAHAAPDGTVTLLFSDIENSTPLNEHLGDARWLELLHEHNALIEREVRAHRGYVVKTMGDGYMVAFKSAADGLHCAIAIQAAAKDLAESVRVRIGIHTGEMTREGDDFFGRHVNLAARVAGHAVGGEVLVSSVTHELVAGQGFEFVDGGERAMKGFIDPVRVWEVRCDDA
jgi:eukaryotic-like serine/threonine-protein kinase